MALYFSDWNMERDQAVDLLYKQCFYAYPCVHAQSARSCSTCVRCQTTCCNATSTKTAGYTLHLSHMRRAVIRHPGTQHPPSPITCCQLTAWYSRKQHIPHAGRSTACLIQLLTPAACTVVIRPISTPSRSGRSEPTEC